ncbi:SDR family oxidoreductase [Modestobacter versicolor]|uniref:NAD(P)-dependent dehydrogenase (Short-subunit alcohol dehydrogenase family) n=1 Tax=Modestobacter versicolor TaxID=429133 RepID=A0A323V4T7_9ACTN|nr:SDR family oxidoreductase [Modestobacter versicolor]MBB3678648.1 NAD(P)-dependent dehydrogenase (short-subunit alcohol dehydrogenase family) [Modestobacter versicolor]PZA19835.1 short-chain dehydrogenase [Modestobacter versicolor]
MDQALNGRTVLVTGANGGLGEQFVHQALERGARAVFVAARTPRDWDDPRVRPLTLDITDPTSVAAAAATATDVDLLVNNAGIAPAGDSISGPEDELRRVFETNFFGTLRVATEFAPVLAANGGGTLLNVLSLAAWINVPTGYAASKAAMWSATNALRVELRGQGTHVVGLLVGMVDTPMSQRWTVPKVSAASVVSQAYDGVAAGSLEVLADEPTRDLKARLSTPAEELYPWLDEALASFVA